MKSSIIWTIVFLLLFIQLINSEQDLTFSNFVDKFNKKAAKKGFNMGSRLLFIVQISNTVDKLKKKLEAPRKEFMNSKKLRDLLRRIPNDLTVNVFEPAEINARGFIEHSVTSINNSQIVDIPNAGKEVCSEIAVKPPIFYDKVFDNWFKVWDHDPINAEHVREVEKELKDMTIIYESLLNRFNEIMKSVEAAEAGIQYYWKFINREFDRLLKLDRKQPDAAKAKEIMVALQPLLEKIFQQQQLLIQHLGGVKCVLGDYNENRIRWVEFLMSMRESLTADRRTSVHMERIIAFFANLLCGHSDF
ncbi:uncharacterized protein LOC116341101 [Contarinia nasturtii]|uniref:uncharacterized protein LOC116341101 n=1 Tax=Contarinia nasturtii TaxID=265458 RepID=UPI0012D43636|nr:uncharacterized protein LOC116341101 [Contarinia nasturtii]